VGTAHPPSDQGDSEKGGGENAAEGEAVNISHLLQIEGASLMGCLLVALSLCAGCLGGTSGNAISWETNVVHLTSEDFYIEADGMQYLGDVGDVHVHSDRGWSTYCTLELEWLEHGKEMRLFIYFTADTTHWWADEIRTYDGQFPDGDWIFYTGIFFKSELGSAFIGDVDPASDPGNDFEGRIHFGGLELQPFFSHD
jgi:hypothetical protein